MPQPLERIGPFLPPRIVQQTPPAWQHPTPYFPQTVHFCNPHVMANVPIIDPIEWVKWDFRPIAKGHVMGKMGAVGRNLTIYLVPAEMKSGAT